MHQIFDSTENYLEAIVKLTQENGHIRSVDLANFFDISRASVSNAVKKMEEEDYLRMEEDGGLTLTPSGKALGESIYDRHLTLRTGLLALGVDKKTANEDACKIEHAISEETFALLKEYLKKKKVL